MTPRCPPISSASSGKARPEKSIRLLLLVCRIALIAASSSLLVGVGRLSCRRTGGGPGRLRRRCARPPPLHPACPIPLARPCDAHSAGRHVLGDHRAGGG